MATATETKQAGTMGSSIDFGTPEYTTVKKDVAYGTATAEIVDGKIVPLKDGKKEDVVIDVDVAEELGEHFDGSVVTTVINLPQNWAAIRAFESKTYLDADGKQRDTREVLDELVTLMRPGMNVKATNRRNSRLLDKKDGEFTFSDSALTNGVYDLTDEITSPSKRVFRTEEQKTWDNLSNLQPEVRETVWRAYLSATGKEFYIPSN